MTTFRLHAETGLTVSSLGLVYYRRNDDPIKTYQDSRGYESVSAKINGTWSRFFVHRLIAQAFIPNPNNLAEVNHKNGIRNDNLLSNLEWCSHEENIQKAYTETGVNVHSAAVIQLTLEGVQIRVWDKIKEAAVALGISPSTISKVLRGKNKTAGGFLWKYVNEIENNTYVETTAVPMPATETYRGLAIIQTDQDGVETHWNSVCQAAKSIGVDPGCIHSVLKGITYTCKGSTWRYEDESLAHTKYVNIPEGMKQIPQCPKYGVSNTGSVCNLTNGRLLKPMQDGQACVYVHLADTEGKKRSIYLGRIVAQMYMDVPTSGFRVEHIDKDQWNNNVENLKIIKLHE